MEGSAFLVWRSAWGPQVAGRWANAACDRFLCVDAMPPSVARKVLMSDRAPWRLCARLLQLGAIREQTGRRHCGSVASEA
ncbi:DUF1403 family protein [Tropicimonas marinistellae]|uniref:DUF1403 family protein n=1 Tax=Tropicimonas marinistellae TaxID=1739787 RepID=UPI00122E5066